MLCNTFAAVLLASLLACGVTTIGIIVISKYERWAKDHSPYFVCFAAGVLISVSFMHIVPKSFEMNIRGPVFLLVGYLAIHVINRFVNLYVCNRTKRTDLIVGLMPILAIGFHSFIDGVIYSVTFKVSILTGSLAAIGMIFHEFPEGIVTFVLLERGGYDRRKAALYAFLAAALSTPLGTLLSFPLVGVIKQSTLGILLALSAGALVYVGATHLLPEVEKENHRYTLLALAAGVLVAVVIVLSKA